MSDRIICKYQEYSCIKNVDKPNLAQPLIKIQLTVTNELFTDNLNKLEIVCFLFTIEF